MLLVVPGRRLGRVAAWALPFISIAWALVRLYRDPAVFAFDPFGGYFPGPIYDEALRPPLRLVWYRLALGTGMPLESFAVQVDVVYVIFLSALTPRAKENGA
jgi:hypothetical protein